MPDYQLKMNLEEKSTAIKELFEELEGEMKPFQQEGGLPCISGCGFCCVNPNIAATPLEFLPLAFDLFSKGLAEEVANQLALEEKPGNCILYRPQSEDQKKGFCGSYPHRGMICRLFGSSARRNNKSGTKELITCKLLKENFRADYLEATNRINEGMEIPIAAGWYTRLADIDSYLSQQYPINQAILLALESVLRYKFYQGEEGSEGQ